MVTSRTYRCNPGILQMPDSAGWPPAWAGASACTQGWTITEMNPVGWDGHHHYQISAYVRHWVPSLRFAIDFSRAGGLQSDVTGEDNCYSEEAPWRIDSKQGWVLYLVRDTPADHTFQLTAITNKHADPSNVNFLCPVPSPPPVRRLSSPPPAVLQSPSPSPALGSSAPSPAPPSPPVHRAPHPPILEYREEYEQTTAPEKTTARPDTLLSQLFLAAVCAGLLLTGLFAARWAWKSYKKSNYSRRRMMQRVSLDDSDFEDDTEEEGDSEVEDRARRVQKPVGGRRDAPAPRASCKLQNKTLKTFVELRGKVHSILLPTQGVTSWAELSQRIHEVCERSSIPDLPSLGTMHIVLNLDGRSVPVTSTTRLSTLIDATNLRVTIGTSASGRAPDQK
ncbi:hypothetical protein AB1Y20_019030 [Prymnesium parvum]|uniref:Uncharacterized protein n=1 Tax=Prymnesium parvum TaxID=97485 RepID=A0AB34JQA8_PRYPA